MAFLGKEYKLESQENFEEFLKSIGVDGEELAKTVAHITTSKLEKDGDTYIYTSTSPKKTSVIKFKSGVEQDEEIRSGVVAKSTYTVDGNTLTQVIKHKDDKEATFKRVYTDDTLTVTITSNFWDGTAIRKYKAL